MCLRLEKDRPLSIYYTIAEGALIRFGKLVGHGYSGLDESKNDPLATHVPKRGPIPAGAWYIGHESLDPQHGPVSMHLIPLNGTETYGRCGLMIHGDSSEHPGKASEGCIVLERPLRELIAADVRNRQLIVLPSLYLVSA